MKRSFRYNDSKRKITDTFKFARMVSDRGEKPPGGVYSALWFRGQAKFCWGLVPSIARPQKFWGRGCSLDKNRLRKTEYAFLHRFRRYAHAFHGREITLWEAITMAQHHRLPTRLLDWTSSPLVALYFATEDRDQFKQDASVYMMRLRKGTTQLNIYDDNQPKHPHETDPLKVTGVRIIYPMMSTNRLVTQSGAFTIQDPDIPLDKQAGTRFEADELDLFDITRWTIPRKAKADILRQLERVAINHRTLFPDLDGVGAGLLRAEMLRVVPHSSTAGSP